MNPIAQGLSLGYSAQQLLGFISKAFPAIAPKIRQAKSNGHSIEQILGFLSNTMDTERSPGMSQQQIHASNTKKQEALTKYGLKAAGKAAITAAFIPMAQAALQRALPANIANLAQAGNAPPTAQAQQLAQSNVNPTGHNAAVPPINMHQGQAVQNATGGVPPSPTIGQNLPQSSINQAPQQPPNINAPIQTPNNITQPPISPQPEINPEEILKKHKIKPFLDRLESIKAPRDYMKKYFVTKYPEAVANIVKETGRTFDEVLDAYLGREENNEEIPTHSKIGQTTTNELPESNESVIEPKKKEDLGFESAFSDIGKGISENLYKGMFESLKKGSTVFAGIDDPFLKNAKPLYEKGLIKSPEDLRKFSNGELLEPKIEKAQTVISPQGVGQVLETRNGKALIEIDGKKHQVSEEELIQSPLPEKDLADLYDDMIAGIEKTTGKQVSRNVEWAGYDPKTNELAYKPHGSDKLYVYDDISPEDVELLTNLLTQRKSTGENFIGAWQSGTESPIGAAMYQLIKKLQAERGGKGNEYKNRYETIYDAIEPAKLAAKRRYAERKKKAKKPRID